MRHRKKQGGRSSQLRLFLYSPTHRASAKEVRLEARWFPRSCHECGAAAGKNAAWMKAQALRVKADVIFVNYFVGFVIGR